MSSALKSANRLWQSPTSGVLQYALVMGGLIWLTIEGAAGMGYNWQWYQIPRYFYRVIDEELIWGPLATGLVITIEISLYSMLLTL
ncbi:MAG: amino acid ABC transporter permease, partial [Pseudomonadota bacterium]|nr:amino acid ABC transporter permease [Pseudomonadota bacterium]